MGVLCCLQYVRLLMIMVGQGQLKVSVRYWRGAIHPRL
jgi:hypothetical protein